MDFAEITTLMLCNVPCDLTGEQLVSSLDAQGFGNTWNLLHLVSSIRQRGGRHCNLGYAFVNFLTQLDAIRFANHFEGLRLDPMTDKQCTVRISSIQGFEASLRPLVRSLRKGKLGGRVILRF
mmetsp:Transcript_81711/g.182636  ORF Transcript_81711/g.182636 Transcript_81711/m.182636 type:complete len:123 (-) Transcript_81711:100-468(-)